MKTIPVAGGHVAIVDDEDYEDLAQFNWSLRRGYPTRNVARDAQGYRGRESMHRRIMQLPADVDVDHKNRNRLDNRRANLWPCNDSQNVNNRPALGGTSRYKGVTWHKQMGRWQAGLNTKGRFCYLGLFADEIDAAHAYDAAAAGQFGEFAYLNFPVETAANE